VRKSRKKCPRGYLAIWDCPFEKRIDEIATRAEKNSGEVSSQSDALRQELQTAIQTATRSQTEAADSLRSEIADQQENLEAAQAALAESLGESINAQPPTSRDWKLAEAEYLLRIANHRLLMERDALTAGQLLTTADKILADLGDFSVFDVRSRLADEDQHRVLAAAATRIFAEQCARFWFRCRVGGGS